MSSYAVQNVALAFLAFAAYALMTAPHAAAAAQSSGVPRRARVAPATAVAVSRPAVNESSFFSTGAEPSGRVGPWAGGNWRFLFSRTRNGPPVGGCNALHNKMVACTMQLLKYSWTIVETNNVVVDKCAFWHRADGRESA